MLRATCHPSFALKASCPVEVRYPQPAERDCTVSYDEVFFAGAAEDDDREGGT